MASCATSLRSRRRDILVVVGIAVSQVTAIQCAERLIVESHIPSFFMMYFSTNFNVLLALPLLLPQFRRAPVITTAWKPTRLAAVALVPFYALWAGANTLYAQGLAFLPSPLVVALFGVTPALVALLSVPLLGRRLTLLSVLAVLLSAGGVALIAQPWQAGGAAPGATSRVALGVGCVLGASACAALYKVAFRRCFGDVPPPFVLLVLALIGAWSLTVGTAIFAIVDLGAVAAALGGAPAATWAALSLKSCFDLAFNGLIALGLSFTHPLFIAVGTILSTPLNVAVEYALRGVVPDAAEAVGIVAIVAAFGVLLADEHVREKRGGAPPDAVFVRRTSDPVAGSVQGEAPDARLRGDGPRSDNLS